MIPKLDRDSLSPFLTVAMQERDMPVRVHLLHACSKFNLTEDAWAVFRDVVSRMMHTESPGSGVRRCVLEMAVRVPFTSVRNELREIAADEHDPDHKFAGRLLAEAKDPSQIEDLLRKAASGGTDAFRLLAAMPLEKHGVRPKDIPSLADTLDENAPLWRSLALARLGEYGALHELLDTGLELPLFDGSPWSAYDAIARIRPIPHAMNMVLRRLMEGAGEHDSEHVVRLLIWASTGMADAEGNPLEVDARLDLFDRIEGVFESSMSQIKKAIRKAKQLERDLFKGPIPSETLEELKYLPQQKANELLVNVIRAANRKAIELDPQAPTSILIGNDIVELVSALPGSEDWPVAKLIMEQVKAARPALDFGQMAWIMARDDPAHVLQDFSTVLMLEEQPVTDRLKIANLLNDVAEQQMGIGPSPFRGAGPGGSTLPTVDLDNFIDDEMEPEMMAMDEPADEGDLAEIDVEEIELNLDDTGVFRDVDAVGVDDAAEDFGTLDVGMEEPTEETVGLMRDGESGMEGPATARPASPSEERFEPGRASARASRRESGEPHEPRESVEPTEQPIEKETDKRKVHAAIRHHDVERNTFVAGEPNIIRCWIGLEEVRRAAVADEFIPTVTIPREGLELTVQLCWGNQSDTKKMILPAERSARTGDCDLRLDVPEDEAYVCAQIVFRYRGRVFESVQVEAHVLQPDQPEAAHHKIRVRVQTSLREVITLSDSNPCDSAFICGHPEREETDPVADTVGSIMMFGSDLARSCQLEGAEQAIDWLNTNLFVTQQSLVRQEADASGDNGTRRLKSDDQLTLQLLRTMARHGSALHKQLRISGMPDPGERLQVLNFKPSTYVPVEFVYDRGYPADDAALCEKWETALECNQATCTDCTHPQLEGGQESLAPVICPLGFWSLGKVIERRDVKAFDEKGPVKVATPDRRRIPPINVPVFGASYRVSNEDRSAVWKKLQTTFEKPIRTQHWSSWRNAVKENPQLLLVLPHHGIRDGLDYLEIGSEDLSPEKGCLSLGQLDASYVNPNHNQPGPIVVLLGCQTGTRTESGYVQLARTFQQLDSAIVLGTMAKILGRHAAPVACELIDQLNNVSDENADFGSIMRQVRRTMLAKGYLMSLCLVALGDAEWQLTPRA